MGRRKYSLVYTLLLMGFLVASCCQDPNHSYTDVLFFVDLLFLDWREVDDPFKVGLRTWLKSAPVMITEFKRVDRELKIRAI